MRFLPLATLFFAGLLMTACEQNASKRRNVDKVDVKADPNPTTKIPKPKATKDEATKTAAATFCDGGLELTALKLDPLEKNLDVSGTAQSLCQLIKASTKKVFLFQLVSTDCADCATKTLRTENYFSLSSYVPHIEYLLLFTDKSPSEGEVTNFTLNKSIVPVFDTKGVFGSEISQKNRSDGSEFLIIGVQGEVLTHSGEKYLEAIGKAEALAKKIDQNLAETLPDPLKASTVGWDGSTIKNNKRFSLTATE